MKAGLINMGVGLLVAAIGLAITFGSYAAVSESGGHYTIASGAVVFGGFQFILGFFRFLRGLFTKEGRATLRQVFWPQSAMGAIIRLGILAAVAVIAWILAPDSWKTISPASLGTFPVADDVNAVAYSPNGKWIAVALGDSGLEILNASTGAEGKRPTLESYQDIQAVAFSADGHLLAAATSSGLRIWSSADWATEAPALIGQAAQGSYAVAFSPDGKEVATGSILRGMLVWNAANGAPLWQSGTQDSIDSVVFSPDGKLVASGSESGDIKLWTSGSNTQVRSLNNEDYGFPVSTLAFLQNGLLVAGDYQKPGISIFDSATGALSRQLQAPSPLFGSPGNVWSIVISPDGAWIAAGYSDRSIRIFDAKTYSLAHSIFGHARDVKALAFSPDGHELASGGADHVVKIWASP
jgi:DNA-binding beta-propeller fold protein YncE